MDSSAADSSRPIADKTDLDAWGQSVLGQQPGTCDDGSRFASALAGEDKPLLTKEIWGGFDLPCAPTFWDTFYDLDYTGGGVGLIVQQLPLSQSQSFTPSWFSISGIGNRPASGKSLPDWLSRSWTPTASSSQFASLYEEYCQPTLFKSSPSSGDYQAVGLPSAAQTAFVQPKSGLGTPEGVLVASDGTAWFVTPGTGSYTLTYNNGVKDVAKSISIAAPEPF